jgi:prepilin-type N-terminal cleavage/methylation domain-containing protein
MKVRRERWWGKARGRRRGGAREADGYSLLELLVVLTIIGLFVTVMVPNISRLHENYALRTATTGAANYLKLGRMKAVGNNATYFTELDNTISPPGTLRNQCGSKGKNKHMFAVYKEAAVGSERVEECFGFGRNITVAKVGTSTTNKVGFEANGAAKEPKWYLVKSRNGKTCQLVCVNLMGAVYYNDPTTSCTASPYGASGSTPCPTPE